MFALRSSWGLVDLVPSSLFMIEVQVLVLVCLAFVVYAAMHSRYSWGNDKPKK